MCYDAPMKLAALGLVLSSSLAFADRLAEPAPLEELATAAKCSDKASPWRPWCVVAVDFAKGTGAALPSKNLVGFSVALENGKSVEKALSERVTFVTLGITKNGKATKLRLSDINPENDDEKAAVAAAIAATTMVFKGKATTAKIPKALAEYASSRKGEYDATSSKTAWTWTGKNPSELRKVGKFWAMVETTHNGVWATVLTDAWTADKK